jgi:hypothetical protein
MKTPLIHRPRKHGTAGTGERGVTFALVAVSIVAILAMAALSIDVATLYIANAEAQRAADAAALAGARVLSLYGVTGDPTNAGGNWAAACALAKQAAIAVASQNTLAGASVTLPATNITIQDSGGNGCGSAGAVAFGVNPQVKVLVQKANLPLFFAPVMRAFFSPGASRSIPVSATATAEVYNPSESLAFSATGQQRSVTPRCVKPWIIPNKEPKLRGGSFLPFVDPNGGITNPGLAPTGLIGEQFVLRSAACTTSTSCNPGGLVASGVETYIPADIQAPFVAVPNGASGSTFQQASAGCDTGTVYACGTTNGVQAELMPDPGGNAGDTAIATRVLINDTGVPGGPDNISVASYPFSISAGTGNPLVASGAVASNAVISASNSVVTLPIMDDVGLPAGNNNPFVTIKGYLQVFIMDVSGTNGDITVKVLNVSGCGTATGNAIRGTSPVPVRLIQGN